MGWWSSSTPGKPITMPSEPAHPQSHAQPASPLSTAPPDPDFYAAHPHLTPATVSRPSATSSLSPSDTPASSAELNDPSLPRTMSCRAAFDSAFYCASLGGHFNDIYRYGQLRSCSEHWSDFWFCMRTNNNYSSREEREAKILERYAEKERKLREGPNSEDIWKRRRVGEEIWGAFGESVERRSES